MAEGQGPSSEAFLHVEVDTKVKVSDVEVNLRDSVASQKTGNVSRRRMSSGLNAPAGQVRRRL